MLTKLKDIKPGCVVEFWLDTQKYQGASSILNKIMYTFAQTTFHGTAAGKFSKRVGTIVSIEYDIDDHVKILLAEHGFLHAINEDEFEVLVGC